MNLRKMIFWNASHSDAPDIGPSASTADEIKPLPSQVLAAAGSNVISLPSASSLDTPSGLNLDFANTAASAKVPPTPVRGLMDAPELKSFFDRNHFGLGRHNGSNYRTQEALVLGKEALVSTFQNTLSDLMEKRQAKLARLTDQIIQTKGFCNTTTGRLEQATVSLDREILMLREQFVKAGEGKGWVLESLNLYQIGFGKGLNEAIEYELLGE
jgi:hypothetical protein